MNDKMMSIMEHLDELKKRMFRVFLLALIFSVISLFFYKQIFNFFTLNVDTIIQDNGGVIAIQKITEGWVVAAKLAITFGVIITLPYFFWELSMFFKPALKQNEQKYIFILVPFSLISFCIGALFAYIVVIPRLVNFLIKLSKDIGEPVIMVAPLISQMVTFIFWLGIIFELPIIMFLLAKIQLVTYSSLKKFRRWMILFAFIFGALITPTDPISQILVAIPVMLLFEIGMLLVRVGEK
ncbi:MAG: twin-arginine translocase subunit TatC [Chloroflexi bacterium]|nr:twin-arginine translocase subunit TatC [Chloroflexota bacterium]